MRKLMVSLLVAASVWMMGPALQGMSQAQANTYIAYWGKNLFIGIAYHRYGCALDGAANVATSNTYQGYTATQYCAQGRSFNDENNASDTYYGYSAGGNLGDDWLGYYYGYANWDYGVPLNGSDATAWQNYSHSWQSNYANNSTWDIQTRSPGNAPNHCSYNVLTNCNSDCWIGDFSTRQGAIVPTLSPCI